MTARFGWSRRARLVVLVALGIAAIPAPTAEAIHVEVHGNPGTLSCGSGRVAATFANPSPIFVGGDGIYNWTQNLVWRYTGNAARPWVEVDRSSWWFAYNNRPPYWTNPNTGTTTNSLSSNVLRGYYYAISQSIYEGGSTRPHWDHVTATLTGTRGGTYYCAA